MTKLTTLKIRISLRRELRLALLAAMEACWAYAAFALAASFLGIAPPSAFAIFLSYWVALAAGRIVPLLQIAWARAQMLVVALALVMTFYLAWAEIYARRFRLDPAWIAQFARGVLTLANGLSREHLLLFAVAYTFARGLGFAQRPLTLWFVGFQFRLGIVAFFLILSASAFTKPLDLSIWILVYFSLALLAVALARIEEMSDGLPLGPRWAVILFAAVTLVIILGVAGARVFTLEVVENSLRLFTPLWSLFSLLIVLLAIPLSFFAEMLFNLLKPLFANVGVMIDQLLRAFDNPAPPPEVEPLAQTAPALEAALPVLKTLLVLAILFALGRWVARALHRRMRHWESAAFVRESIADQAAARVAARAQGKRVAKPARNFDAENIRRIYAALAARARAAGVARRIAETPDEFLPRLAHAWRECAPDLETITRAYVAAHYGEARATPELSARVRAAWHRVEKEMRAPRQSI